MRVLEKALFIMSASSTAKNACHFRFQAVPGFFVDRTDEARQDHAIKFTTLPNLGLLDREYETDEMLSDETASTRREAWQRFNDYVHQLNANIPGSASHKVLFITRHGQGYHNVMNAQVGHDEWNVCDFLHRLPSLILHILADLW